MSRDDADGGTQYFGPDRLNFTYPVTGQIVTVSPDQHRRLWERHYPGLVYDATLPRPQENPGPSTGAIRLVQSARLKSGNVDENPAISVLRQSIRKCGLAIREIDTEMNQIEARHKELTALRIAARLEQDQYREAVALLKPEDEPNGGS